MNKLALGTVQFGLAYGINNPRGEIPQNEVFEILDFAYKADIDTLDTAYSYGSSEEKIGRFIKTNPDNRSFNIISKLPGDISGEPIRYFQESLKRLNQETMYGYMAHSFDSLINNLALNHFFSEIKSKGLVEKIGVSLYYPGEIDILLDKKIEFDFLQVPYNIFDQRFEPYFVKLKKLGKQVYTRSAFLQGLVFKDPSDLPKHFVKIKDKLSKLRNIAAFNATSIEAICLNFCLLNNNIDKVVVGVDSRKNLEDLVEVAWSESDKFDFDKIKFQFREDDEDIILPTKWQK